MPTVERLLPRAERRAQRQLLEFGEEAREARQGAGLSQASVAAAVGMSRPRYTQVEAGRVPTLQMLEMHRLAAVLGLDLIVRTYPGPDGIRDAASQRRLDELAATAASPLSVGREVPLPARNGAPEQRAWDIVLTGDGLRTCAEIETRLRDIQATERRLALKRRDDPPDRFVLVVAGTGTNRRVLREHPGAFGDLPRISPGRVLEALKAGRHPPSGLIFL